MPLGWNLGFWQVACFEPQLCLSFFNTHDVFYCCSHNSFSALPVKIEVAWYLSGWFKEWSTARRHVSLTFCSAQEGCPACTYLTMEYCHALPGKLPSSCLPKIFNNSQLFQPTLPVPKKHHPPNRHPIRPTLFKEFPSPHCGCSCHRLHVQLPCRHRALHKTKRICKDLKNAGCGTTEETTDALLLLLGRAT